ncbi:TadE/TadG family type IV pilus assembly protein [Brevibacillus laterosporus]|uniref:Pilus assembly protein n=1 Tax=Brevibacillus laterosporus TaxID=1465 RepID=A0AAP3GBI3_BRELA|nr:TadE family protein [Brevibacillus laterosporus]MCR8980957.1 pilus assembly protein [Brevibacillus laterosporus]MCZ0808112.1 pilus assembly protein [Brevibacillus laterosporus]MCZ0826304.1 pilus assembly protein [Brevibacillus laterosporus]MCZ0850187.1 pilus assembly protein [Brevibacillus laterosporus]MED1663687.1 pilus assembly protein [Brevibacillus laterosporus]
MFNRYRWFRYVRNQRGSQIIEYVLVFPLLWFLFIYGCDQFSIMYQKQKALAASYEAGRFACVQPNYGLATYMAKKYAEKELEQALYFEHKQIELIVRGGWSQGNHVEAKVRITFPLLGSGKSYTVEESYLMMIENARDRG